MIFGRNLHLPFLSSPTFLPYFYFYFRIFCVAFPFFFRFFFSFFFLSIEGVCFVDVYTFSCFLITVSLIVQGTLEGGVIYQLTMGWVMQFNFSIKWEPALLRVVYSKGAKKKVFWQNFGCFCLFDGKEEKVYDKMRARKTRSADND